MGSRGSEWDVVGTKYAGLSRWCLDTNTNPLDVVIVASFIIKRSLVFSLRSLRLDIAAALRRRGKIRSDRFHPRLRRLLPHPSHHSPFLPLLSFAFNFSNVNPYTVFELGCTVALFLRPRPYSIHESRAKFTASAQL